MDTWDGEMSRNAVVNRIIVIFRPSARRLMEK
jgi:hypothetical protein